jgi:two-component system chemotaxis sensor kinase CheA
MTTFTTSDDDRRELIDSFVSETDDVLNAIEQSLLLLEDKPDDEQLLHDIFRGVHTLKGNAACLQFEELTGFAHVMEDLLDRMRDGRVDVNASRVSLLLDVVDALRDISVRSVQGNGAPTQAQSLLIAHVGRWAAASGAPPVAASREVGGNDDRARAQIVRNLRVGIDKLDRMLNLTGEIATARGVVRQLVEDGGDEKTLDAVRELDRLSFELQEAIMNVRLVPVGPSLRHFFRIVRDLSTSQGKQVRLVLEGEDVEVDTTVIEQLKDPITHMIRNAIDHGIELPELRVASGKSEMGTITITALHQSGGVLFRLSDDGAGLDEARIGERVRILGLDPERMSRQELWNMTLRAGFSTAGEITDLSGRGVGMDVVRRNVESLRGTLSLESRQGIGTTIDIRLPLTVAVIDGFAVGVADETYVIPIDTIVECTELPAGAEGAAGIMSLRGEAVPFLRIRELFGLESDRAERENVVIVEHQQGRAAIVVDRLYGSTQVVMKPMGRFLRQVAGISGSSILGNGRVALILDIHEIIRHASGTAALYTGSES